MPGSVPGYQARAGAGRSTLTRSGSCSSRVPNGVAFTSLSRWRGADPSGRSTRPASRR